MACPLRFSRPISRWRRRFGLLSDKFEEVIGLAAFPGEGSKDKKEVQARRRRCALLTQFGRTPCSPRMTVQGHEDQFPPIQLSGRCQASQETSPATASSEDLRRLNLQRGV